MRSACDDIAAVTNSRSHYMPFTHSRLIGTVVAGGIACLLAACGGGGNDTQMPGYGNTQSLTVALTGDQETPDPVNTAANASATLTLDRATRTLSATLAVDGTAPTLAHIHAGAAGSNGDVLFPLTISGNSATLAPTVLTQAQLDSLDAGNLYMNVHSADHPGGEIRGQIAHEVFNATLSGAQQTPPVTTTATGVGRLELDPMTRTVTGEVDFDGVVATMAHVHSGSFGNNGDVLVPLMDHGGHGHFVVPPNTRLTQTQVDALRAGGLYFNVHSVANPNGEMRGQIGRRVFLASLDGNAGPSPSGSAATGTGWVTYDPITRRIEGQLMVAGMAATMAHLHLGTSTVNGPVAVPMTETAPGSGQWLVAPNTTLTLQQAQALTAGGVYANVHSAAFPNGEIRGQMTLQ
jgi:hypothetical protein